jgi:predicted RNase H-like nuclease
MISAYAFCGIDACPGGWLLVKYDTGFTYFHAPLISELFTNHAQESRVLIDMPIGLVDGKHVALQKRPCDTVARKRLGSRASSIFSPPCMEALFATSYADACEINHSVLGIRISKQSWNIVPKIKELNAFLHHEHAWRTQVLESHPELAFQFLNGNNPLQFSKKKPEGIHERVAILKAAIPESEDIFRQMQADIILRKFAPSDDMVDALALTVLNLVRKDQLENISHPDSPVDMLGNKMAIWL